MCLGHKLYIWEDGVFIMEKLKDWVLRENSNQLRANTFWNIVGSFIFAFTTIALTALTKMAVGASLAADFTMAFTTAQLFLTLGYFEIRTFQVTDIVNKYSFQEYYTFRIITSFCMALAGIGYIIFRQETGTRAIVIFLMCIYKMMDGIADVFEGEFHKDGRLDIAGKSLSFRTVVSATSYIVIIFITRNIVIASLAAVIMAVLSFAVFDLVFIKKFAVRKLVYHKTNIKKLFGDTFLLFIGSFMFQYIVASSKYAVDTAVKRGQIQNEVLYAFGAVYLPVSVISLASSFIFKPMLTTLAVRYHEKQYKQYKKMIALLLLGLCLLTLVCIAGAYVLGVPVLSVLYDVDLTPFKVDLLILIFSGGFNAAVVVLYYSLTVMRRQKYICVGYSVIFVAAFILPSIMTTKFGTVGAAWANVVLMACLSLIFLMMNIVGLGKVERA